MLSLSPTNFLYAITDCNHFSGDTLAEKTMQVLNGGCRLVQYRDKSGNPDKRLQEATQLQELCQRVSANLIINDDVDLALKVGAAGVHLGQGDGDAKEARQRMGQHAIIGVTCHASLPLAANALDNGASYVAFGRFFASATKPTAPPASIALLRQARELWPNTVIVAIGGINQTNASHVITQGANYTAACQSVYHADDIVRCSERFSHIPHHTQSAGSVL